ncbi:MAG: sialidase family protein [Thermoplasmatota archaeon]
MRPSPQTALCAVLLLAAVAGCVSSPAPNGSVAPVPTRPPLRPDTAVLAFAPPIVLGNVPFGAEVSVAASPDGSVYVTSPASSLRSALFPPSPPLWRSDDGGATYKFLGTPGCAMALPTCPSEAANDGRPDLAGPGDAEIAVTRDGVVHWAGLFGGGGAVPYQRSTDKGDTWSKPVPLDQNADREWLTPRERDGALFASWRFGNDSKLTMRASYDSGRNWTAPVGVAADGTAGPLAVAQYGNLLLLPDFGAKGLQVERSTDQGKSWTTGVVVAGLPEGHIFPVAGIDSNGTAYIVWASDPNAPADPTPTAAGRSAQTPRVFLAVSHDAGVTWSPPQQLNAPGTSAIFPWLVAGGPGRVAATWYENALGTPLRVGGPWRVMMAVSTDADRAKGDFRTAVVTPNPIRIGPICTDGGGCTTDGGDRSLLDFFEVDLHPDGYPVLAWAQDGDRPHVRVDVAASRMTGGPDLLAGIPLGAPAPSK